ncbi:hypothetical protein IJJ05_01490, partial [Candidatus Saccharibacteria bacterium]|nr:hypothetical protein [Candidatus Saccharibacteria bacterium]
MKNLKLVFSLFLFCLLFSPHSAQAADSVITDVNVAVPISCSMFGTGMNSHNATIPNGTGQEGIGTTTLKAFCNDSNGFSIYAIGYTDSTDGKNVLVGNAISSDYDIATGLSMGGANSQWAMSLNTNTSATYPISIENSYNAYQAVPSSYTLVATSAAKTDVGADAVGASLTTTYRAYISPNQPSGNYNGKVKYVMVHPASNVPNEARTCAANKICYWPNGGDMTVGGVGVVDSMGDQSISSSATSATLWASNFKRAGYGFAGWSDAYDYVVGEGSATNPDAHIYGPNEDITFTAG